MLIDAGPPWALFFVSIALVIAAVDIGYRLGKRVHRKSTSERESPVGAIAGSILGLQAFMLAFTFGIVSDRYDAKKGLVRENAHAIRTAWQMSDFIPDPDRTATRSMLLEYLEHNIAVGQSHDPAFATSENKEGQKLQMRMWEIAVKHGSTDLNSDIGATYVQSINELAKVQAERFHLGIEARIPTAIWVVLLSLLVLGMMAVGYHTAIAESRRPRITGVLAVSFSLVIALIAVMDHPLNTIMSISQQPMIELRAELHEAPAAGQTK